MIKWWGVDDGRQLRGRVAGKGDGGVRASNDLRMEQWSYEIYAYALCETHNLCEHVWSYILCKCEPVALSTAAACTRVNTWTGPARAFTHGCHPTYGWEHHVSLCKCLVIYYMNVCSNTSTVDFILITSPSALGASSYDVCHMTAVFSWSCTSNNWFLADYTEIETGFIKTV